MGSCVRRAPTSPRSASPAPVNNAAPVAPLDVPDPLLRRTLDLSLSVIAVPALFVAVYLYFRGIDHTISIAPALISGFAIAGQVLLRRGKIRWATYVLLTGLLVAATVSIVASGSVRTAGVILLVGAVVCAGIFADRLALLLTTVAAVALLCVLAWAEWLGLLPKKDHSITVPAVITYIACLVVVALMVFYSRRRDEQALARLHAELKARQRTEQERDRSMDRFARIFRSSPSPMLAQSARDGMILDANPAFERCYGYTRQQVLGQSDHLLWADPGQRIAYLEQLAEHRRTERVAGRSMRADGSAFDALVSSEMSDDPGDRLVITTSVDVSEQKEAMERLRKSEERFAKAFNFSPLHMSITRLSDGALLALNHAADGPRREPSQPGPGAAPAAIELWTNEAERAAFVEQLQRYGHVHGLETRLRQGDGHTIDARVWAEEIEIDGEECVLACATEITEEKRREVQLLALTRGMAGPSGNALFQALTLHMAQVIGADMVTVGELREPGQVQTLAAWRDGSVAPNFVYPLDHSPCEAALERPSLHFVGSNLSKHFPLHPVVAQSDFQAYLGQSLRDEDGTPVGMLVAMWRHPVELPNDARAFMAIFASRANAELVRLRRDREILRLNSSLEERVRERTAELHKLNAELDSFAYSVSHDLKSPLRAIDGFTQLLQESLDGRLDAHEAELIGRVLAGTHRMSTLIADLLALARVSQGPLQRGPVDLSALALQVLQAEQEKHPGRVLRWQVAPGLHAQCDERLARIALANLLGNAVKYTRDQAEAVIEFGQQPGTNGAVGDFFVRDNGIGFDMAHADLLFKPFQRLHMPSSGFEGTGIGLATVHRIVERHGGRIEGFSRPGQGAEFRFSLSPATTPPRTA